MTMRSISSLPGARQPGAASQARRAAAARDAARRLVLWRPRAAAKPGAVPRGVEPPCIILVCPTMGENIGAAARAMKNFGLRDLRIVAPRDGWPNDLAIATSVGAVDLIESARLCGTLAEAAADLTYLYAATARRRFMHKDYVMSRDLAGDYASHFPAEPAREGGSGGGGGASGGGGALGSWGSVSSGGGGGGASGGGGGGETGGQTGGGGGLEEILLAAEAAINAATAAAPPPAARVGIMFGRESSGLTNEEVAMAGKILVVDSDPDFAVLNLAQAVLVCCYELYPLWRRAPPGAVASAAAAATPAALPAPPAGAAGGAPPPPRAPAWLARVAVSNVAGDSCSICDNDNPGYFSSGSTDDYDLGNLTSGDGFGFASGSSSGGEPGGGTLGGDGVGAAGASGGGGGGSVDSGGWGSLLDSWGAARGIAGGAAGGGGGGGRRGGDADVFGSLLRLPDGLSDLAAASTSSGPSASSSSSGSGSASPGPGSPSGPDGLPWGGAGAAAAAARAAASGSPARPDLANDQDLASLGDSEAFLERLFAELEAAGYFEVDSRKASTQSNIRNLLRRVPRLSKQEVASLHGILSKLVGQRSSRRR